MFDIGILGIKRKCHQVTFRKEEWMRNSDLLTYHWSIIGCKKFRLTTKEQLYIVQVIFLIRVLYSKKDILVLSLILTVNVNHLLGSLQTCFFKSWFRKQFSCKMN